MLAAKIATKMDGQLNEIAMPDANPWVPWAFCHFLLPYPESHLENEKTRILRTVPAQTNPAKDPKTRNLDEHNPSKTQDFLPDRKF